MLQVNPIRMSAIAPLSSPVVAQPEFSCAAAAQPLLSMMPAGGMVRRDLLRKLGIAAKAMTNADRTSVNALFAKVAALTCASEARKASLVRAGSIVTIDLGEIQRNYLQIKEMVGPGVICASVVKANAYGFGASKVADALTEVGCRHFYVAHLQEALDMRAEMQHQEGVDLCVLHGPMPGAEKQFLDHGIVPVLNSLQQIAAWSTLAEQHGISTPVQEGAAHPKLDAILQFNTGMNRAGIPDEEMVILKQHPELLKNINVTDIMSHLANADDPDKPSNEAQHKRFVEVAEMFPKAKGSLAASSGIFIDKMRFDKVRVGAAQLGMEPLVPNPMRPVLKLSAKIQQLRRVPAGVGLGYGLTGASDKPRLIATIANGFADGSPRALGNLGKAYIGGVRAPIVGKVSMDMILIDVTAIEHPELLDVGALVDLIDEKHTIDDMARDAGTIPAAITSNFSPRMHREYVNSRDQERIKAAAAARSTP